MNDLKRMSDDPDSQELLSVVPSVHHQRVDETLDDGHTALGELLLGVSAGGVGCGERASGSEQGRVGEREQGRARASKSKGQPNQPPTPLSQPNLSPSFVLFDSRT